MKKLLCLILSAFLLCSGMLSLSSCQSAEEDPVLPVGGEGTATSDNGETHSIQNDNGVSRVHMLAVGDNIIHDDIYADAKSRGDGEYAFSPMYQAVADTIAAADVAYVNQEGPVVDSMAVSGYPSFNAPRTIGSTLRDIGFDVINLANNHMTDKGASGYAETTAYFKSLDGITTIGGYNTDTYDQIPVIEKNGIKIAFLSYTTFTNANSAGTLSNGCVIPYATKADIDRQVPLAQKAADFVVVSMHWGAENSDTPNGEQLEWASYLASKDVDVVLGMHSHTLQPIVKLDGNNGHQTWVAYSLGNFFGGMLDTGNLVGGMMTFDLVKNGEICSIENMMLTPTMIHYEGAYRANADNRSAFQVLFLKDYTDEMLQRHGAQNNNNDLTMDRLWAWAHTVDDAYLEES